MTGQEKPNGVTSWFRQWTHPSIILTVLVLGASIPIAFYRLSLVEASVDTNRMLIERNASALRTEYQPRELAAAQDRVTTIELRALRESIDSQFRLLSERLAAVERIVRANQQRSSSEP